MTHLLECKRYVITHAETEPYVVRRSVALPDGFDVIKKNGTKPLASFMSHRIAKRIASLKNKPS